jgi:hypothetical protein
MGIGMSPGHPPKNEGKRVWTRTSAWLGWTIVLGLQSLAGCSTLPNGRGWGQDATLAPGWARIRASAYRNATDPWTWAPLAGVVVLQVDDLDEQISDWAREETPIFGSRQNAEDASDQQAEALAGLWLVSVAAAKSGETFGTHAWSKTKGVAVELGSQALALGVTNALKNNIRRQRPSEEDNLSFPSGHTTSAFSYALLASKNLNSTDLPEGWRPPTRFGLYTLAFGTAWARVEAGEHFPVDVLFAAGVTNFLTGFVHDAFLGLEENPQIIASPGPDGDGWALGLAWSF